jgi:hypothetical protein
MPPGFFEHLPMKRSYRVLALVNPATWQLKLWRRFGLMCAKQRPIERKDRINPRPAPVALPALHRLAISPDHAASPWPIGCRAYMDAVWQGQAAKETP